jgi:hypothetical protein
MVKRMRNPLSILAALSLCVSALGLLGCGPEPVRAPNPTRSLDERRALEVIRRAVTLEGAQPAPSRDVEIRGGKTLRVDVSIEGHEYGIAYISTEDADKLGDAIQNKKGDNLQLERVGPDGEVRILLLFQEDYVYDDLAGESHELTTITTERALTRDVRDFVTGAKTRKFK